MTIHYNPVLKQLARDLRKNSTLSEILLWQRLRNRQFHGLKFHRQKPIDEYIVDFFCPELQLVIEVDGNSHDLKQDKDCGRQSRLEALGLIVIRFLDTEVKSNLDGVLAEIEQTFCLSGR